MSGRDQLRKYLEQRREAGEKELVLDGLSVEEAMRLLGAESRRVQRGDAQQGAPHDAPTQGAPPPSADWRQVLRQTGAAPDREREVPVVKEGKPAASAPVGEPADLNVPMGIVIDAPHRELFGASALASLDSLDAVAGAVASCTKCPLHSTAKNPVPGSGNPKARLMIVGEAPGANEDEQGVPFVGAAGQLLTKILAAVDLRREDVFICNVLKHRPPGNRNPMPDEVTACTPYLIRQFELIQPRAILALGTFAAQTLLDTKLAIGKLRGQLHRFHGVPLVVTYHPAALLRNPSWKRPTWEDVQLVHRILGTATSQP